MKIQRINNPADIKQTTVGGNAEARAKAIAMITGENQPAQPIVANQNSVSPEEMGAIRPPEATTQRQNDSNVSELAASTPETATPPEAPKAEVTPEEPQKTEQDQALSKQFARLAQQEKALRAKVQQQEQALKAREQALVEREAQLTKQPQIDTTKYISMDDFKNNPLEVMARTGLSYEELTNQLINQVPTDPRVKSQMQLMQDEIKALKADREQQKQAQIEQQTQAYRAAIRKIESDAVELVQDQADEYELISAYGKPGIKEVVKLIETTYKEEGRIMTVEQAAKEVEDYLTEQAEKLAKSKKITKRLQPMVAPKEEVKQTQQVSTDSKPEQQQTMKTLTNATSSSRPLSARERAILAARGELKS
jgi:hypothetical protein